MSAVFEIKEFMSFLDQTHVFYIFLGLSIYEITECMGLKKNNHLSHICFPQVAIDPDLFDHDDYLIIIRKTYPCNEYPRKPHFYIVKLEYAGVYLFFLFLLQNIDCGYSLEPPRRGGSNVYPQSMF